MPSSFERAVTRPRVCIVMPGYLSTTPRAVREADALAGAGFSVRVVFTQGHLEQLREFDEQLVKEKAWSAGVFRWSSQRTVEKFAYLRSGIRQRAVRALPAATWPIGGLAERAEGRVYPELAQAASSEPAEVYIGHYPTGLAAAAWAARRHDAALGYDIEDLYTETVPDGADAAQHRARIALIEKRYVPRCAYLSAASSPMAEEFARRYRTAAPEPVHNCYPWADHARTDGRVLDRRGPSLSLYWFSQTIGLDRGIQDAIRAAGVINQPAQIHLRGVVSADARAALMSVAADAGIPSSLHFHEPVPPADLLSRAMEHDVGLALERGSALNYGLTVTNKFFMYLNAGLAMAATDTAGQRNVLQTCPMAGALYPSGDHRALAVHLASWSSDPIRLADAKRASLDAARTRWNAESEARTIVAGVTAAITGTIERRTGTR